jgi:hypothetical protein
MSKMTKVQTEYALQRLSDHYRKQRDAVTAQHTIPAVTLTWPEMWELVKSGQAKPRETVPERNNVDWRTLFDFSGFTREAKTDLAGERKLASLAASYLRAKDEIMLGDAQEALTLLRDFAGDE